MHTIPNFTVGPRNSLLDYMDLAQVIVQNMYTYVHQAMTGQDSFSLTPRFSSIINKHVPRRQLFGGTAAAVAQRRQLGRRAICPSKRQAARNARWFRKNTRKNIAQKVLSSNEAEPDVGDGPKVKNSQH